MPARIFSLFGAITSGLQPQIIRPLIGGLVSSVSVSPSRLMLTQRGWRSPSRSGRSSAAPSTTDPVHTPIERARPPPRSCHAPTSAGRHDECAEEHGTVLVVLGADQRADDCRADGAVHLGQPLDVGGLDAAGGRSTLGRPLVDVHCELVEAERVIGDPLLVGRARRGSARASRPASTRCRCRVAAG